MTIDDADTCTPPVETLTVHRLASDGTPGDQIATARAVTPTAAVLALDPDLPTSAPPQLPLALVDVTGRAVEVFAVHVAETSSAIALEVEEPVLEVQPTEEDSEVRTLPGRSVWCTIFPRMRGC